MCKNEVNIDFWTETIHMFKQRVKVYDKALENRKDINDNDI